MLAGFSKRFSNKKADVDSTKPSKPSKKRNGNSQNGSRTEPSKPSRKNFNIDEDEVVTLKKKKPSDISESDLSKLTEKVDVPSFIGDVKDYNERLLIHIINHSKVKMFDPFIMGKIDKTIVTTIDNCIRESREGIVPSDIVNLSDNDRLQTLKR